MSQPVHTPDSIDKDKEDILHLEKGQDNPETSREAGRTGTVRLWSKHKEGVKLIPTPSADPRDPLNIPQWRKWAILFVISLSSTAGNAVVGNAGSLISFFIGDYIQAGVTQPQIIQLITIPTLTMGFANLIFMPIALAIGRRPVYLMSLALLFISCIIAAKNNGYEMHIAARVLLGFAAGQSEAIIPLMIKEIFFLHERSTVLAFQSCFLMAVANLLSIFSTQMAAAVGWRNWYLLYCAIAGFCFVTSFFLVPETRYERSLDSMAGLNAADQGNADIEVAERPPLDYTRFEERTLRSDMRLITGKVDWHQAVSMCKQMLEVTWFPTVILITLLNTAFLGISVAMSIQFSAIVLAPPYNWPQKNVGLATAGNIAAALLAAPTLGWANDKLIKWRAKRNNGVHEPEARLWMVHLPSAFAVLACLLFGACWQYPYKFHWFTVIFAQCAIVYAFLAASVVGITYLLDAYPTRSGAVLVVVCAWRGLFVFAFTYALDPATLALGPLKEYGVYAAMTALLGLATFWLGVAGKPLRLWTLKFVKDDKLE